MDNATLISIARSNADMAWDQRFGENEPQLPIEVYLSYHTNTADTVLEQGGNHDDVVAAMGMYDAAWEEFSGLVIADEEKAVECVYGADLEALRLAAPKAEIDRIVKKNVDLFMEDIEIPTIREARIHFINKAIREVGHSSVAIAAAFDKLVDDIEKVEMDREKAAKIAVADEEYEAYIAETRASEMAVRNSQFSSVL